MSGEARVNGSSTIHQQQFSAAGRQECIATWYHAAGANDGAYLVVKHQVSPSCNYSAYTSISANVPTYIIQAVVNGASVASQSFGGSTLSAGYHTSRLLYDSGVTTLWVDGAYIGSLVHNTNDGKTLAGLAGYPNQARYDSVTLIGDEAVTFSVNPSPIGNFGSAVVLSFTSVGGSWVAGTPGSPTFTVDHGVLSAQSVTDPTHATATYTPGNFLGIATFVDPSTGATCQVQVTSDTNVIAPGTLGWNPSTAIQTWLADQAAHGGLVLADNDVTSGDVSGIELKGAFGSLLLGVRQGASPSAGNLALADALVHLWRVVNGGADSIVGPYPAVSSSSVKADLDDLRARWAAGEGLDPWTAQQLVDGLGGDPLASHQDILTEIRALPAGDNQEVLNAIAAAQGDPLATIKAVLDLVFQLDPGSTHSLGELLTAVDAVRGTGSPTIKGVLDGLSALRGDSSSTVAAVYGEVVPAAAGVASLITDLAALASTVSEVLELVTAIKAIVDALGPSISALVPPIWPGLDNATIGPAVALEDGLELAGPLDGLLIAITQTPARAGRFGFGTVSSWRYCGAVIFKSDRGDWEWNHPIGLDTQIVTPKCMTHAAAARLRLEGGFAGTARPFTVGS